MLREIFIIGIGGQGAQAIGDILMLSAFKSGHAASFYPFYGSQMRGGESGCIVKIDTEACDILNPTINEPDDFIVLSDKFFEKYKKFMRDDANIIDAENLQGAANNKNLNIILLKKYIDKVKIFKDDIVIESIKERFKKEEVNKVLIDLYMRSDDEF